MDTIANFTRIVAVLLVQAAAAQVPTISSFSPTSGPIGTSVTINGTNFNTTASNNIIRFGAVRATVNSATSTTLGVTVPVGATFAPIAVTDSTTHLTAYSSAPFLVTFKSARSIDTTTFAAKVDFTTGTNAQNVAIGDLDGDSKPDLVVTNGNISTVSVFRNTSTSGSITASSFAPKVDFATGTFPQSVAIGDVDGDSKPDLVVANYSSNTVSVFRNTSASGAITFASKVDFTAGAIPRSVAIGDIDGDGKPDLAVANVGSNTVSVFRNTSTSGSITFASKVDFTTAGSLGVAIGDLDGDSKPDLVVTNYNSSTVSVFRNTSTSGSIIASSFATTVDFTAGFGPWSVAIGDVDGDSRPDLVVANYTSSTVSVFRNTSTSGSITASSFASKVDFATGTHSEIVAIGDVDGDGKPDLAVANDGSNNTVPVFRNTSTSGSITASSFAAKVDFTTAGSLGVAIGDVDGDSKPDLVVANGNSNTVSVFRNSIPLIAALRNLTVIDSSSGRITIRWNKNPGPTILRYRIYRSTVSPATTLVDSSTGASDTIKTITGLTNGTRYYLRVTAIDSSGNESPFSNEVSATPSTTLSVGDFDSQIPPNYSLTQSYPNPFNPSTTIRYGLPNRSTVKIAITNTLGQEVAVLENGKREAGYHEVQWNANVASGIYFYRIEAISASDPNNRFVQVKKMLLLK